MQKGIRLVRHEAGRKTGELGQRMGSDRDRRKKRRDADPYEYILRVNQACVWEAIEQQPFLTDGERGEE